MISLILDPDSDKPKRVRFIDVAGVDNEGCSAGGIVEAEFAKVLKGAGGSAGAAGDIRAPAGEKGGRNLLAKVISDGFHRGNART